MNLTALKSWVSGETLTAADLNAEFQNIYTHTIDNNDIDSTASYVLGELVIGTGLAAADGGQLHVHTGSAGTVQAASDADEAVFENSTASGVTILSGLTSTGKVAFGDSGDNDIGLITYNHATDAMTLTTNGTTALTLSSAQAATFAGDVTVGGALTLTGGITLNGNTTIGDSSADTLTVNSTITSNLIFTDNTYDIGASGATRPRNLYLSGNGVIGGTLGVTGLITASGGLSGNVTGGTISGTTLTATSSATLQHSASTKLATTSTGIDVTGTVTADGLTVDQSGDIRLQFSYSRVADADSNGGFAGGYNAYVDATTVKHDSTGSLSAIHYNNAGVNVFTDESAAAGTAAKKRALFANNGDISFYEDTGTTAKFFWDASSEALGIGTSSPSNARAVITTAGVSGANEVALGLNHGDTTFATGQQIALNFGQGNDADTALAQIAGEYDGSSFNGDLVFKTNTGASGNLTERARITSGGQLIVGANGYGGDAFNITNGGAEQLEVGTASGDAIFQSYNRSTSAYIPTEFRASEIRFDTGSSPAERVRITSDGITFNGDTAAANALDDYEEGTYSVTDQSGAGLSFTVNGNRYVKIGKLVWIGIELVFPTTSDTNIVSISLPYAQSTAQRASLSCVTNRSDVTVQGYASTGTARVGIIESAASPVNVTNASLSGKYVIIGGVYEAA